MSDSSLIGLYINRIEFYKNKIFILNQMNSHSNILCFDISCTFLFSIDRLGSGTDEYTYLGDFFIDRLQDRLILCNEPQYFMV
jgi:hypothetical protein